MAVSDLIKVFCEENDVLPTRENMIQLWNSSNFTWVKNAERFNKLLLQWWIITWIRKPENLPELSKFFELQIIWVLCDDDIRYRRYIDRLSITNLKDQHKTRKQFLQDEVRENSWPNKQSIQMVLNMSDYYIINEWGTNIEDWVLSIINKARYLDNGNDYYVDAVWYNHFARWIIQDSEGKFLLLHDIAKWYPTLPGWKVDVWEHPWQTVIREIREELWVDVIKSKYLWWLWGRYPDGYSKGHFFKIEVKGEPTIQEDKFSSLWYYDVDNIWLSLLKSTGLYQYINNERFNNLNLSR